MDQLEQVRIEKHKEYLRQTWLPEFFEKYRPLFSAENKAKRTIYRFFKKYVIPDVVNEENLDYIPGLFRARVKITAENLTKPVIETEPEDKQEDAMPELEDYYDEKEEDDDLVQFDKPEDADLNQVMKESLQEYNDTIEQVINESMKEHEDVDLEEYILNQVLMESMKGVNEVTEAEEVISNVPVTEPVTEEVNFENVEIEPFYFVIDIRDYINDLTQPIYVAGGTFYLTAKQMTDLTKMWAKVGSLKYQQDFDYQKCLINDKN